MVRKFRRFIAPVFGIAGFTSRLREISFVTLVVVVACESCRLRLGTIIGQQLDLAKILDRSLQSRDEPGEGISLGSSPLNSKLRSSLIFSLSTAEMLALTGVRSEIGGHWGARTLICSTSFDRPSEISDMFRSAMNERKRTVSKLRLTISCGASLTYSLIIIFIIVAKHVPSVI